MSDRMKVNESESKKSLHDAGYVMDADLADNILKK